jgi:Asp-tRNA(Asn)/Glu-tRNA(Gln) amidotransferase C subunit
MTSDPIERRSVLAMAALVDLQLPDERTEQVVEHLRRIAAAAREIEAAQLTPEDQANIVWRI